MESMASGSHSDNRHVEIWKIKKLIYKLDNCKGNGTSMVTLVVPPKEDINMVSKKLTQELSSASSIKSKTTRNSVLAAITSTKEKVKLYKNTPANGLVIFCGIILMDDGKTEKKVIYDFEPFKPINQSLYFCDNSFHTDPLHVLLEDDEKFGFVVVDGSGCLFATLQGNTRDILQKISVQLPKKHGRGGQSSVRFARLRDEKRHHYLRKVAELCTFHFISNDQPNVKGLVLAGSANFKNDLSTTDMFDKRLVPIVCAIVDVSYGGENGLNQAITLASDALTNVKFVEEKKIISKFFENISQDTGMIVFGVADTMKALEMGAIEQILLFEDLEMNRHVIKHPVKGESKILFLTPHQEKDERYFKDKDAGIDLEVTQTDSLAEWLCNNYQNYGAQLEFITDKSQEGFQFVKGFGGIGGFLRYKIDIENNYEVANDQDDFDADEDFI